MKRLCKALPEILFAFILAAAASFLWMCAATWASDFVTQFLPTTTIRENVYVLRDGSIVIATHVAEGRHNFFRQSYRTIDNQPIAELKDGSISYGSSLIAAHDPHKLFQRLPWLQRIDGYSTGIAKTGQNLEFWYFIHDGLLDGSGYFARFDAESKRLLDYMGKNGMTPQRPGPAESFTVRGDRQSNYVMGQRYPYRGLEPWRLPAITFFLVGPRQVVEVDLPVRRATTVWEGDGIIDIASLPKVGKASRSTDPDEAPKRFVVRAESRLIVLNNKYQEDYSVEIPESMRGKGLTIWELAEGGLLAEADRDISARDKEKFATIPKNGPATFFDIPLENTPPPSKSWPVVGLASPAPLGLLYGWGIHPGTAQNYGHGNSWSDAFRDEWPRIWPTLLTSILLGAALAVWVRRRQRQLGLDYADLWAGFVLILGPAGLFAYLVHRSWPVLEACPACGVNVPRDRETCLHCGAEFPGPAALSTEIRG